MPDDAEKRRRADFIVDSAQSFDHARAQARDNRVMAAITACSPSYLGFFFRMLTALIACPRLLLHDQASRRGHRSWPVDQSRHSGSLEVDSQLYRGPHGSAACCSISRLITIRSRRRARCCAPRPLRQGSIGSGSRRSYKASEFPATGFAYSGATNLRSIATITGYNIHTSDGEIGHVEDFLVDDAGWNICCVKVVTGTGGSESGCRSRRAWCERSIGSANWCT
jgi:hypothetical protein